jgi:hypothetical protein
LFCPLRKDVQNEQNPSFSLKKPKEGSGKFCLRKGYSFPLEKCHAETMKKRTGKGRNISIRAADIVKCMLKK